MDIASSSQVPSGEVPRLVGIAMVHLRLTKMDAVYIRAFFLDHDQYSREGTERAMQLFVYQVTSTENTKPVQLIFCVNL